MSDHPTRYYGNNDLHFINCSCYHRQPWLASAPRRDLFLTVLEAVRGWPIQAVLWLEWGRESLLPRNGTVGKSYFALRLRVISVLYCRRRSSANPVVPTLVQRTRKNGPPSF